VIDERAGHSPVAERLQDALLMVVLLGVAAFLVALVWLHGPDAQMTMPGM
jgi:hypothetical protein